MGYKSLEVYYDIAKIPDVGSGSDALNKALEFRNAAMALVETALEAAGLGEWEGAEIGNGEVNFGFEVTDFDSAEVAIRQAVAGTQFANIREITRYEDGE